jgi:hypothetical protein
VFFIVNGLISKLRHLSGLFWYGGGPAQFVYYMHQYCACISSTTGVLPKLSSLKLKNWWVVYKINPKMHTHRYDEYMERHEDDDFIDFY